MKLPRPLLLIPLSIVVFVGLLLGILLLPGVQRAAFARFAGAYPEYGFEAADVSIGFSQLELTDIRVRYRGTQLYVRRLESGFSLWAWLGSDRLELTDLRAKEIVIEHTADAPSGLPATLAANPFVPSFALAQWQLPVVVAVNTIALEGSFKVSGGPDYPAVSGEFQLAGRDLAPDREGELKFRVRGTALADVGSKPTVLWQGTLHGRETASGHFERLKLVAEVEASDSGLAGPAKLHLSGSAAHSANGEQYDLRVATTPTGPGEPLVAFTAAPSTDGATVAGDWRIALRHTDLTPFLLGRPMPEFALSGAGRFTAQPAKQSLAVQGGWQASLGELGKLRTELKAVEPLRLTGKFDVAVEKQMLHCAQLSVSVQGAAPVLELRTTNGLVFDLSKRRLAPAGIRAEELLRLTLTGLPVTWLAPWLPVGQLTGEPLHGEIAVTRGEDDRLSLRTITPLRASALAIATEGKPCLEKGDLLADLSAELMPDRANFQINQATLTTAVGEKVVVSGLLAIPFEADAADWSAELKAAIDLPNVVTAYVAATGLRATADLSLTAKNGKLAISRCALTANDTAGEMLALVHLIRPFQYETTTGSLAAEGEVDAEGETVLASVRIGQLPKLTLFQSTNDITVTGRPSPMEAWISTAGGNLILRSGAPVSIMDFTLAEKKKTLLDRLKISLKPEVVITGGQFTRASSGPITVLSATEAPLMELQGELTRTPVGLSASAKFNLDLPAWASQPFLFGREMLSAGQAVGEIRSVFSEDLAQLEARATFNNLVVLDDGQLLPVVNLSLKSTVDPTGKFTISVPLLVDRGGRRSDLQLTATGEVRPSGLMFDAGIKSEHLEFSDLLLFLAAAGSPLGGEGVESSAAQIRALSPPSADSVPVWRGLQGRLTLACASVVGRADWAMQDLQGQLSLAPEKISLDRLTATLAGRGTFSAEGTLAFASGLNPYALNGVFAVTEFDLGKFQRALNGDLPPAIEGIFHVRGQLVGEGLTPDDTFDRTRGVFEFASRQGVFRGLKRATDKVSMATKAVDLMSTVLGDKAEKIAGPAFFVDQLAQDFGEWEYDQCSFRLVREPSLDLQLEDLVLVSPETHLLGGGRVTHVPGVPLLDQPLSAQLSLRVKGKLEGLFGKLEQLDGARDPLGYARTKTDVILMGTPARPDARKFYAELVTGKIAEAFDLWRAPGR